MLFNINETFVPFAGIGFQRGMLTASGGAEDEFLYSQFEFVFGVKVNLNENFLFMAQYENHNRTLDPTFNRTIDGETETLDLLDSMEQESNESVISLGIGIPF